VSVSLSYRTRADVTAADRARALTAAAGVAARHEAWVEGLRFWPAEGDGRIEGATQVRLVVWLAPDEEHREVEPADEALMSAREIRHVVAALGATGLDWELSYGEPIGAIAGGAPDAKLAAWLATLPAISDEQARKILDKYPR
jgi:hypothetical protein